MRKQFCCAMALCMLLGFVVPFLQTQATAANLGTIQVDDSFELATGKVYGDADGLVFAGYTNKAVDSVNIYATDPFGRQLWSIDSMGQERGCDSIWALYRDNKGRYNALMQSATDENTSYLYTIEDGRILDEIQFDAPLMAIAPSGDGYIGVSATLQDGMVHSTIVHVYDEQGKQLFANDLNQQLHINGILPMADGVVIYGMSNVHFQEKSRAQVLKVDRKANVVWHYETEDYGSYVDACSVSDTDVVLIGEALKDDIIIGRMAKYGSDGLIWMKEYAFPEEHDGTMMSIVPMGEDFLIACKTLRQRGSVNLLIINAQGEVQFVAIQMLSMIDAGIEAKLFSVGDGVQYMFISGFKEEDGQSNDREASARVMPMSIAR